MKRIALLAAFSLLAAAPLAGAATYSVGPTGDCSHVALADALAAAAANSGGPHRIKLRTGELSTAPLSLSAPAADITIEGGHASCAASAPTPGQRTELRPNVPGRVLRFINDNNTRRVVELRQLTLRGGQGGVADELGGGGALILLNSTLVLGEGARVEENRAGNGGGVSLYGTSSSRVAELTVTGGAVIANNDADGSGNLGNGGGVFALDHARVLLRNGTIERNFARGNGGGVSLATANTSFTISPASVVDPDVAAVLFFNVAGEGAFSASSGLGGAIHTRQGAVTINAPVSDRFFTFISDNIANMGGAIHATGAAGTGVPFTFVAIRNAIVEDNQARGKGGAFHSTDAVDWVIDHTSPGRPCMWLGRKLPCSLVRNNAAFNTGTATTPGGGVGVVGNAAGSQRGIFRFSRTLFEDNHDYNSGKAAVAFATGSSEMIFERCIFSGNTADTSNAGALLRNAPGIGIRFVYNTVLANSVDTLFHMNGGLLRTQGSILWSPGAQVWTPTAGATMDSNACLIAHDSAPGAIVLDPRLDADFVPPGRSPAIDFCDDDMVVANVDGYRAAPGYDVPGVPQSWGNNDLGAIENRDILFFGSFGIDRFLQ